MFDKLRSFFRRGVRITLWIPVGTWEAIEKLKLSPGDAAVQVFKDSLETHNQVIGEIRNGGVIYVHRGATVYPLRLDHLNTAEKRRAGWTTIRGGKED